MADGVRINTKGLDELIAKLRSADDLIKEEINGIFENGAKEFVARAKRDAPKDVGFLVGEINYERRGEISFAIASQSLYAGFLEFGTKGKFQNIAGYEDVAAQLKAQKSGTYEEGLANVTQWVKRKGITMEGWTLEQVGWYIFHLILVNGIKAQPYFFKQVEPMMTQIEKDLQNIVKVLD